MASSEEQTATAEQAAAEVVANNLLQNLVLNVEEKGETNNPQGIKETEQADSSQSKPDVSGGEKDSIGIPEIKEQNHNSSLLSSNNGFSLNGANNETIVAKIIENNADIDVSRAMEVTSNATNGSSTPLKSLSTANSNSEKSDALEFSLSEVNSGDFNIKSMQETPIETTKMDTATSNDATSTQKLLPKDILKKEVSEETFKPIPESEEYLIAIDDDSMQINDNVKCPSLGTDSESIKGSQIVEKNDVGEKNVDTDNDVNNQETDVDSFLQEEGVVKTEVIHKESSNENAKHEFENGIGLKGKKLEDLMDEKGKAVCAEINSFVKSDVSISVNAKNEGQMFTKEEDLKVEDILKNEKLKGRELAADGDDQMDGDQGSVEMEFMVGDDDQEEEHGVGNGEGEGGEGNEINSEEEEEEKSELLVAAHDISPEFNLNQLSEKVGLIAIEENVGQPIEFKVNESEEKIEEDFNEMSHAKWEQVEEGIKDDVSEIPSSDVDNKQLKGNFEEEESKIYSEAAAASKLETVSGEGQLSESAAAVVDVDERRLSLESRPLISTAPSVKGDEVAEFEKDIKTRVDQWTTPSSFTDVTDNQIPEVSMLEIEEKSEEKLNEVKNKDFSRRESVPEMLQYRKPTKPEVNVELNRTTPEATAIELSDEKTEETQRIITDNGFKFETADKEETAIGKSNSTPIETKQLHAEGKNQSKLEEDKEERAGKSSFDLPVADKKPLELSDAITKRDSVELKENDALKQTNDKLDSSLLLEETENKGKEKKLSASAKLPKEDKKLEIVASKTSLVQQEGVKKMHLPVKSVTASTSVKKSTSREKALGKKEADNDSGVDETTQAKVETKKNVPTTLKGIPRKQQVITSPNKRLPSPTKTLTSPIKQMASARTPLSPSGQKFNQKTPTSEAKKLPMNKIVVGQAASPNLKEVKSKIGSMTNMTHRPGGGTVRVESKQLNFSQTKSKVGALNATYKPGGGDKKIESKKLEWNAKSKVGSLDNAKHKPGGGDKKIESVKLDFKDKAAPKVGSTANLKHQPGGGKLQIEDHKLNYKDSAKSKIGSLDNVLHRPGGGNVVIYDDCKRPTSETNSESQSPPQCESPTPPHNGLTPTSGEGNPD